MKTRNLIAFALIVSPVLSQAARAAEGALMSAQWVRDDLKQVFVAPKPLLKIMLTAIHTEEDYWDRLTIETTYRNPALAEEIDKLQAKYPKYQLSRAVLSSSDQYRLVIPALGVDQSVETMPGSEGPYMTYDVFLSRSKSAALRKALASDANAIQVFGNAIATVPTMKTVERFELGREYCDRLLKGDGTVYSVVKNFTEVSKSLAGLKIQFASTREALQRSLLDRCVDLSEVGVVDSFKKLLGLRVNQRSADVRIVGETRQDVESDQKIELLFDVQKTID